MILQEGYEKTPCDRHIGIYYLLGESLAKAFDSVRWDRRWKGRNTLLEYQMRPAHGVTAGE